MNTDLQRIMLIEDDPDIQAIGRLALETVGGLTVQICNSGQAGLEQVKTFAPDLILLDMMMPEMDGIATMRALRARPEAANIPIVFMTAKAQGHEIANYKALGALDVISKPFDPMTLAATVREIWSRA